MTTPETITGVASRCEFLITIKNTTDQTQIVNVLANTNSEHLYEGRYGIPKELPKGVQVSAIGNSVESYDELLHFLEEQVEQQKKVEIRYCRLHTSSAVDNNAEQQMWRDGYICKYQPNKVFGAYGFEPMKYCNGMVKDPTILDIPICVEYTLNTYISFDILPQTEVVYTIFCDVCQQEGK